MDAGPVLTDSAVKGQWCADLVYDDAPLRGGNPYGLALALRGSGGTLVLLDSSVDPASHTVSAAVMQTGSFSRVLKKLSYRSLVPLAIQPR